MPARDMALSALASDSGCALGARGNSVRASALETVRLVASGQLDPGALRVPCSTCAAGPAFASAFRCSDDVRAYLWTGVCITCRASG
jgi:hypothetical protein